MSGTTIFLIIIGITFLLDIAVVALLLINSKRNYNYGLEDGEYEEFVKWSRERDKKKNKK